MDTDAKNQVQLGGKGGVLEPEAPATIISR